MGQCKARDTSATLRVVSHLVASCFNRNLDNRVSVRCCENTLAGASREQLDLYVGDLPIYTFVPGCALPGANDVEWVFAPGKVVDPDSAAWDREGMPRSIKKELALGVVPCLAKVPPPFEKDNYKSLLDNLPQAVSEFERVLAKGKLEGPLPYRPYSVMPMGLVVKIEFLTDLVKLRVVIDATRTGLNDGCHKLTTSYDCLPEALIQIKSTYFIAKVDLSDAFWSWSLNPLFANLYGVKHPSKNEFYRWRYLFFGFHPVAPVSTTIYAFDKKGVSTRRNCCSCGFCG